MQSFDHGFMLLMIILIAVAASAIFVTRTRRRRTQSADSQSYLEALQAMLAGDDSTAFSRLKEVVATQTGNLDAYIKLGDILRKHKKVDRAIRLHQELTLRQGMTPEQNKWLHRSLALDYLAADNFPAARQALTEILKIDKADLWAAGHRGLGGSVPNALADRPPDGAAEQGKSRRV